MTIAAIIFVIFMLSVAAVTFFVLKRAIKMAVRAAIIALIVLIAIVGSASLWWFGINSDKPQQPATIKKTR